MAPRDAPDRRLWVVRGSEHGRAKTTVVKAASQLEAAYLGWKRGLSIVVVGEAVPYDGRGGDPAVDAAGIEKGSSFLGDRAFGRPVTAAQRATFMAAGIAVALLNWQSAHMSLFV
jgi:hypothetical protein